MLAAAALAAHPAAAARHQIQTKGLEAGRAAYWTNNSQPTSGDDMYVRNAMHDQARDASGKMFAALQGLLHGDNPALNFVSPGSPLLDSDGGASANVTTAQGQPTNSVNIDPATLSALINPSDTYHDWSVQTLPHEYAHLRQTPDVLSSIPASEGGAQGFADTVAATAAQQAGIPFDQGRPGYYDGDYADYVKQANQRGREWTLFGQFGNPAGTWP